MELRKGSFDKLRRPERQSAPLLRPAGSRCIAFGARFEGHLLHRMDWQQARRLRPEFFLLHLDPHDSARNQHHGKNKCCDDCPFARRFVHRCGRLNASPVRPVPCWGSLYPDHLSVPRYFRTLQCCSLHISLQTRGLICLAKETLCTVLNSNNTLIRSNT
jgi:hypothetical protein